MECRAPALPSPGVAEPRRCRGSGWDGGAKGRARFGLAAVRVGLVGAKSGARIGLAAVRVGLVGAKSGARVGLAGARVGLR
ncbi:hypothetical protein Aco03nite_044940 [Actinoplanes couchii]|uniref:Uncharacterized protein n=1 Tax=Actinoplanes couchii TaxID=403638 RepID=A0ABQ3XC94_9ACTN|nr:hypothetical protein Aco03nite_044940 [Actinoplanes couchii]